MGALVARQRLLPRAGSGRRTGRIHVRRGGPRAIRRCARRSWINSSFLGQASTESQGPWDSNYQIEDDYSWFIPGKKGDHDMKFGFRYNYTELRRVSQVNSNGTFTINTDAAFDPLNPRTYPERLTIRTGTFNEFINNHTYELFVQDKWRMARRRR